MRCNFERLVSVLGSVLLPRKHCKSKGHKLYGVYAVVSFLCLVWFIISSQVPEIASLTPGLASRIFDSSRVAIPLILISVGAGVRLFGHRLESAVQCTQLVALVLLTTIFAYAGLVSLMFGPRNRISAMVWFGIPLIAMPLDHKYILIASVVISLTQPITLTILSAMHYEFDLATRVPTDTVYMVNLLVFGVLMWAVFYMAYREYNRMKELAVYTVEREKVHKEREMFLRYIFHELRVPFNSISVGTELLLEEKHHLSPEGADNLGMMSAAIASMSSIINDTLDMSKINAGKFEVSVAPMAFSDVVKNSVYNMTPSSKDPENRVTLTARIAPRLRKMWVLSDKGRLQQIVCNLLSNAIKFSPHDGTGRVKIEAQVTPTDSLPDLPGVTWMTAEVNKAGTDNHAKGDGVCGILLTVADNGAGVPAVHLPNMGKAFQQLDTPGTTSKMPGTGLGLSICLELATMLGGRLGVRSKTGKGEGNCGTEMFLFLRLSKTEAPAVETESQASSPRGVQAIAAPDTVVVVPEVVLTVQDDPAEDDSVPLLSASGAPPLQSREVKLNLECKEDESGEFPAVLRVMVVDDNTINRKLLGRGLKKLLGKRIRSGQLPGCKKLEINEVEDGQPAVEWEAKHAEGDLSYHHVITMDAQMPGLCGFDATRALRANGFDGFVFGCTGNSLQDDQNMFLESGADAVFIKPIPLAKLADAIVDSMRRSRGE